MVHKGNVFFVAHPAKNRRRTADIYNIHNFFKNCIYMYFYMPVCAHFFLVCNKEKFISVVKSQ